MIERNLYVSIWRELSKEKSMVLLAGPRQCGKTTLTEIISKDFSNTLYFNWDIITDRKKMTENPYFFTEVLRKDETTPLITLDEIHKHRDWKNYLKGAYDKYHSDFLFLVSGSGRLDIHQKGGDSMAGRYRSFHLWPLTLAELHHQGTPFETFRNDITQTCRHDTAQAQEKWERLNLYSGFPEPYLAEKPATYRRWSKTYHKQLIREDIQNLTDIKQIDDIELLFSLLPSRVGAPLSIPALSSDLRVSYNTLKNWLSILDQFYLTFTIAPWSNNISRAIHKEKKTYLFDYAGIENAGAKFENMIALELFRAVSNWNDLGYGNFGLHYIRTKEGREVDFLIAENNKPMFLLEAKIGDDTPAQNLLRFQKHLKVPAIQLLETGDGFKRLNMTGQPLLIAPAAYWLPILT